MKFMPLVSLLFLYAYGGEVSKGFLSIKEYGQAIYENKRKIACNLCHGAQGEGGVISFVELKDGTLIPLKAPDIRHLSLTKFQEALNKSKGVMPNYFLSHEELLALYIYLQDVDLMIDPIDLRLKD